MSEPATVTDIEIHFISGEPVYFMVDASRGDEMVEGLNDGTKRYILHPSPEMLDVFVIEPRQVRYTRIVTRPKDEPPQEHYAGDGITVVD